MASQNLAIGDRVALDTNPAERGTVIALDSTAEHRACCVFVEYDDGWAGVVWSRTLVPLRSTRPPALQSGA